MVNEVEIIPPNNCNNYLDATFNKRDVPLPVIESKYKKNRLTKIERAGQPVIDKLMMYARESDLSYNEMAKHINEDFKTSITKSNIVHFLKTNKEHFIELMDEEVKLNEIRANLYLEHNKVLTKDIKMIDSEIEKLNENDMMEDKDRALLISKLLDNKGRLLMRHAKLSGRLESSKQITNIDKAQINIFNEVEDANSEVIQRLKKANFETKQINK